MALSLQQVQKQTQRLIMTPQMQQSIQLLQMNTIELEQLTQAELLENPFLELDDEKAGSTDEGAYEEIDEAPTQAEREESPREADAEDRAEAGGEDMFTGVEREVEAVIGSEESPEPAVEPVAQGESAGVEETPEPPTVEEAPEKFEDVDLNWEDVYEGNEGRSYSSRGEEEEREFTEYTAAKESLYDHLLREVHLSSLDGRRAEIGEYLVGGIDDNGYLNESAVGEAARQFGVPVEEILSVLSVIQEFEPAGVGARTPAECLLLQMKALGSYSELAREVLEQHFEPLQRRKFKEIARKIDGASEKEIVEIHHKVSRLDPKPGRAYSKDAIQYIIPDVFVKIIDGEVIIYLEEGSSGHLSINRLYRRLLRLQEKALTKEEKAYALEKFRGALMLIKNIEKRKSTILKVTEAIMQIQRDFLDKGVSALRPLTLREIAEMVGMHESTIARVTSKKYVETPQGLFPLKYFFSSGIASSNGTEDSVSSRAIRDKLAALIAREDPKKPLSDQRLAQMLNDGGYTIARRTVAKYREQLKILPAKLRRQS
jgi:RNA polymerase sigma-54 factor